jgi:cytochrome oxidase Cu insertion factor (SCO1/SenC/PrrC family)
MLVLLAAVACGRDDDAPRRPNVVDGVEIGKPIASQPKRIAAFTMQEARQGALSNKDLAGRVWIGATLFTHCPTICPTITMAMAELQEQFKDDEDFRLVSVTVDPARDTPEVLQKFAGGYGAEKGRWFFVRHPQREEIGKFVKTTLFLPYNDMEPLEHSRHISLIDRDGTVRGMWDGTDRAEVEKLAAAIRALLDAKKRP